MKKDDTLKLSKTRFQIPFYLICLKCLNVIPSNTKVYARIVETKESYKNVPIYKIHFKCRYCKKQLTVITDPKNEDYEEDYKTCKKLNNNYLCESSSESLNTEEIEIYAEIIANCNVNDVKTAIKENCTIQEIARRRFLKKNNKFIG